MQRRACIRQLCKKTACTKVQTVAEPHSPSLYGESISASSTTPLGCTTVSATLVIDYPPRHNQYTIIQEDCQCRKRKILQISCIGCVDCADGTKQKAIKTACTKVQTVAKPHSPSLYGESISASFTTPLGCTQSRRNFGYKLPTEAQSIYNNSGELSMQKNKNPTRYLVSVAWIVQTARNKRQ